jgi:DNA-binding NarL/FixJ family response regulator
MVDVTVLIVDDSAAFRGALADVVAAVEGLRLVGDAASGDDAIRLVRELRPDLVILDDRLGGADGVETAARIAELDLGTFVVLVTADDVEALEERARGGGAQAVLDKGSLRPALLRRLRDERPR